MVPFPTSLFCFPPTSGTVCCKGRTHAGPVPASSIDMLWRGGPDPLPTLGPLSHSTWVPLRPHFWLHSSSFTLPAICSLLSKLPSASPFPWVLFPIFSMLSPLLKSSLLPCPAPFQDVCLTLRLGRAPFSHPSFPPGCGS